VNIGSPKEVPVMTEERDSVHTARVSSGRTTYFLDMRRAVNGRYYLAVTESRRNPDGSFDSRRMMVFEEALPDLSAAVADMASRLSALVSARREGEVDDVRRLHPRAFMKWDESEEERLSALHRQGRAPSSIADDLGRTLQAVSARLEKLGLTAPAAGGDT
jgi:hypothetical protein